MISEYRVRAMVIVSNATFNNA